MFLLGSAYPTTKLGLNAEIPPILFGSLRMFLVFIFLLPFCKFQKINKKYILPLIVFTLSMGTAVNLFLYLSVDASNIIAPIVIIAPLSIPLAILLSSIFMNEKISKIQWLLIFSSIFGVVLIGFDPKISEEILGMILIGCMAFFYAFAQVISRYLKSLDLMFTNSVMGLVGFITLMLGSIYYEGQTIYNLQNISLDGWLLIFHHGVLCSIMGHMMMFYLYKFYPVGRVLPFYALFPVFGIILSYVIFGEIPTLLMSLGGLVVITSVFYLQKIR